VQILQQIVQVEIVALKLVNLILVLAVDRLQLFIERLELLA
jgi:hypothetical protein